VDCVCTFEKKIFDDLYKILILALFVRVWPRLDPCLAKVWPTFKQLWPFLTVLKNLSESGFLWIVFAFLKKKIFDDL